MALLQGPNFESNISLSDLQFMQEVYTEEILTRMKLIFGSILHTPSYGIVDSTDPALATPDELRPFVTVQNALNPLRVDVQAGIAIVPSGQYVILENKVEQLIMGDDSNIGAVNIIYIEYFLEESEQKELTRFNTLTPLRFQRPVNNFEVLKVAKLDDFNNPTIFTLERKQNIIVLAVATVIEISGQKSLNIDLSRTTYSFNRPWFSPMDIKHREEKGTGSIDVPHSLGLSDLSAGDLTLYQQILKHGMILSKDIRANGYPGNLCWETVPRSRFKKDTSGQITARSKFGGYDRYYIELQAYPSKIGSAFSVDNFPARGELEVIGAPVVGKRFKLNDGEKQLVFQFQNGSTGDAETQVINISGISGFQDVRDRIVTAVNVAYSSNRLAMEAMPTEDIPTNYFSIALENKADNGFLGNCAFDLMDSSDCVQDNSGGMQGGLNNTHNSIAVDLIPGTNLLVLQDKDGENFSANGSGMYVYYFEVSALEPPTVVTTSTLSFSQPTTTELVIAQGKALNSVDNPNIALDQFGGIPVNVNIYCTKDGNLISSPQVLMKETVVADVQGLAQAIQVTMIGPAKIRVGLAKAGTSLEQLISVQLDGQDTNFGTITETLSFTGTYWTDSNISGEENPYQFLTSSNIFSKLEKVVVEVQNAAVEARILVYANLEPLTTQVMNEVCPVAKALWTGYSIRAVESTRVINNKLEIPSLVTFPVTSESRGYPILSEPDFSNPIFLDTVTASTNRFVDGINVPIPDIGSATLRISNCYRSRAIGVPKVLEGLDLFKISIVVKWIEPPENPQNAVRLRWVYWDDSKTWVPSDTIPAGMPEPLNYSLFVQEFWKKICKLQVEIYGRAKGVEVFLNY